MENHFVQKVSRFFPFSFTSCQFQSVPDAVESSIVPITKCTTKVLHDINYGGSVSCPKMYKKPPLCKPQEPKISKSDSKLPKNFKKTLLLGSNAEGRRCPPVTPISVVANSQQKVRARESKIKTMSSSSNSGLFSTSDDDADNADGESDKFFSLSSYSSESFRPKSGNISSRRFGNNRTELGRCYSGLSAKSMNTLLSQSSLETTKSSRRKPGETHGKSARNPSKIGKKWPEIQNGHGQFGIEGEVFRGCEVVEASTQLYYSNSCHKTTKTRLKTRKSSRRIRHAQMGSDGGGRCPIVDDDKLEESYAVEKSSSDPHGDFRTSMVEMIIEKQLFGAKDLERLLHCFLSLNSPYYHMIILEAFTEICDTLFTS